VRVMEVWDLCGGSLEIPDFCWTGVAHIRLQGDLALGPYIV
jgi:hypothetical protein